MFKKSTPSKNPIARLATAFSPRKKPGLISQEASYLEQLKFDEKLGQGVLKKYLTNVRLVALIIIMIWIAGAYSFSILPRRLNPEVKIPIVTVVTTLPGAAPQDVESLVTIPLEDAIQGTQGIDTMQSVSQGNVSIISMQFLSSTDRDKDKDLVQTAIDTVTLPDDANDPQVTALDFEGQAVWKFSITSTADEATLHTFADKLKKNLEDVTSVDRVTLDGNLEQEIQIILKPETLATYKINQQTLSHAISTALASYPAGSVRTNNTQFSVTIDKSASNIGDLRNTIVTINNQPVKLGDIATIVERPKPGQSQSYYADAKTKTTPSVTFSVFKTSSANIDKTVNDAQKVVNEQIQPYGSTFKVNTDLNLGDQISEQFGDLINNYRDTIILVFITLFAFLGIRQAIIASFTIPLTFLVSFTVMNIMGLTLNFLSLFALLLSLGLLVDDTIVTVTAMTAYYRTGKFSSTETGLLVWRDFIVPIWTTTISTVWAFLPLLLASGIIGEFIKTIPIVVTATLYASTAIAVLITLPLMMVILKPQVALRVKLLFYAILFIGILIAIGFIFKDNPLILIILGLVLLFMALTYDLRHLLTNRFSGFVGRYINLPLWKARLISITNHGIIDMPLISQRYQQIIDGVLQSKTARRRTVLIVVIFSIFSYALVPLGFVVNEFFPKQEANETFISIELPPGTNQDVTDAEAKRMLEELRKTPNVEYVTAETGVGVDTQSGGFSSSSSNNILYTLVLPEKHKRKQDSIEISDILREKYKNYTKGTLSVIEEGGGPPVGSDIQITFMGADLGVLDQLADSMQDYLKKQPGVTNVSKSIKPGVSNLVFVPDDARLAQLNISRDTLGFVIRNFVSGQSVDTLQEGSDKEDITMRVSTEIPDTKVLSTIMVPAGEGSVPLTSIGHFVLKSNPSNITREDRKRTLTVSAAVTKGYSVSETNGGVETFAKKMELAPGYSWKTGGVNEENQKSVQSIFAAMILSAVLILGTMVLQFTSFRKALIVMFTIPLAISGVFIVFAITGTPLSFPALIGTLALFGIVVNNAMMIIDKVNRNLRFGMHFRHAISDAAASRLEPIVLGSLTTVVGLIPITITDPLWRGLGGAIISGLLFSGAIMLFFIPVVYYMWYHPKNETE